MCSIRWFHVRPMGAGNKTTPVRPIDNYSTRPAGLKFR